MIRYLLSKTNVGELSQRAINEIPLGKKSTKQMRGLKSTNSIILPVIARVSVESLRSTTKRDVQQTPRSAPNQYTNRTTWIKRKTSSSVIPTSYIPSPSQRPRERERTGSDEMIGLGLGIPGSHLRPWPQLCAPSSVRSSGCSRLFGSGHSSCE